MKEKEPFYQVPKNLFGLYREGKINHIACFIYMLILDRYKLSIKNNLVDKEGRVYVLYTYEEISAELNLKRRNSISEAIKDLEKLNLIEKKRRFNKSTVFYINDTLNSNENDTLNSNENDTLNSNENDTLIITTNKNNLNKNYYNNNNKENDVAGVIRQEIKFLIKTRNIKIDNVLKYCSDIERIKQVFEYADKNNKSDGWVIACLRDNYSINQKEDNQEKDYSKTMDEILRGG
ncbi:replication initiator protein A [Fusobacterium animalis]|uniref:replication initiator protein A n=1 Tax=Fusobacterium animalis TaxID=76859 RepID=UPI0030CC62B5